MGNHRIREPGIRELRIRESESQGNQESENQRIREPGTREPRIRESESQGDQESENQAIKGHRDQAISENQAIRQSGIRESEDQAIKESGNQVSENQNQRSTQHQVRPVEELWVASTEAGGINCGAALSERDIRESESQESES